MWIIVFSWWIIIEKHYKTRNCKDFDLFHTSKEKNMQQKTKEIQNLIQWLTIKDHIATKDRRLCTTTDGKEYNNCRKATQQLICSRTTVDVRL